MSAALVFLTVVAAATVRQVAAPSLPTVTIGLLWPQSDDAAVNLGDQSESLAAAVALAQINNDSTVLPNVRLEGRDHSLMMAMIRSLASDSDYTHLKDVIAEQLVADLVVEGSVAAVGAGWSSDVMTLSPYLTAARIPLISPSATATWLSNATEFPYFARTCPPDSLQARAMADLVRRLRFKRLGVVFCEDAYCEGLRQNLMTSLATAGGGGGSEDDGEALPVLFSIQVNRRGLQSAQTARSVVASIETALQASCDGTAASEEDAAILLLVHDYDAERLVQAGGDSLPATLIGSESVGSNPRNPAVAASSMLALRLGTIDSAKRRQLAERVPGVESQIFAQMTADAVWGLAHAMHAHSLATPGDQLFADGAGLVGQLAGLNFSGVTGNVVFDRNLERANVGYELVRMTGIGEVAAVGRWTPLPRTSGRLTFFGPDFEAMSRQWRRYPCSPAAAGEDATLVSPLLSAVLSAAGVGLLVVVMGCTLQFRRYKRLRTKRYLSFLSHHQAHGAETAQDLYIAFGKHKWCCRKAICDKRRHFLDVKEAAAGEFVCLYAATRAAISLVLRAAAVHLSARRPRINN
eukprot:SAG11_NODE_79_length_17750_cov_28.445980_5_plen_579_part_00